MRYLFLICSILSFVLTGCGAKEGDEPTKYRSQAGLEKLSNATKGSIADNPKFFLAKNISPHSPTAKDIDNIIRPVLVKLFKDARLVASKGPEAPQKDGDVVEDRLVYSVKVILTEGDGDKLHGAFRAAGFAGSPRLGSKPTHSRGNVYMSLFRSTSLRGYSFVIVVDTGKQKVELVSYKLGSKYDRLM